MTSAARTAGWFTAARLATAVCAAVAGLIAAAELGPTGRGEVAVGLLVGYFAAVLLLRGLESSLVPIAAGKSFEESFAAALGFLRPSVVVATCVVVCATALSAVWELIPGGLPIPVGLLAIGTALQRTAAAAGAASADMRRQPMIAGWSGALLVMGAVGLWLRGESSPLEWLWLYGLASAGGLVLARLPMQSSPESRAELNAAAWPSLAGTLAAFLSLRVDRVVLPVLASTESLGIYVVASTIVELAGTPSKAMSQALAGRWRVNGVPALRTVLVAGGCFAAATGLVLFAAGRWTIPLVLGADYAASADLLALLAPAAAVQLVVRAVAARLLAWERHRAVGSLHTIGFGVSVPIMLLAVPIWGAQGAAFATLVGHACSLGVALWFSRRSSDERAEFPAQRP